MTRNGLTVTFRCPLSTKSKPVITQIWDMDNKQLGSLELQLIRKYYLEFE